MGWIESHYHTAGGPPNQASEYEQRSGERDAALETSRDRRPAETSLDRKGCVKLEGEDLKLAGEDEFVIVDESELSLWCLVDAVDLESAAARGEGKGFAEDDSSDAKDRWAYGVREDELDNACKPGGNAYGRCGDEDSCSERGVRVGHGSLSCLTIKCVVQHIPILKVPTHAAILGGFQGLVKVRCRQVPVLVGGGLFNRIPFFGRPEPLAPFG